MIRAQLLDQLTALIVAIPCSHPQRVAIDGIDAADTPLSLAEEKASANAVLLFDGVFLLRPELADQWDYRVLVAVTKEVALQRAMLRDLALFGSPETIKARYLQRYFPGQELYYQAARPQQQADVIVDNNRLAHPQLIFPS